MGFLSEINLAVLPVLTNCLCRIRIKHHCFRSAAVSFCTVAVCPAKVPVLSYSRWRLLPNRNTAQARTINLTFFPPPLNVLRTWEFATVSTRKSTFVNVKNFIVANWQLHAWSCFLAFRVYSTKGDLVIHGQVSVHFISYLPRPFLIMVSVTRQSSQL